MRAAVNPMAEPARLRVYTVSEAKRALPRVKAFMDSIQESRRQIMELRPLVWPLLRASATNGGNARITDLTEQFARLTAAVRQIVAMGILVKDVDAGLVDFLSLRRGQRVYLCWKYGEEELEYWHDTDAGYAGRQPIIEEDFDDMPEDPFIAN